jgi:hypothetical protein
MPPLAAVATAMVFPASSWFYLKVAVGQVYALDYCYLPWAYAAGWVAATRYSWFYASVAGGLMALGFLGSGPDALFYGAVGLAALLGALALTDRRWQPLAILVGIGLFTIGFAAVKLVPCYRLLQAHPRFTGSEVQVNDAKLLLTLLFSRDQNIFRAISSDWGFWESGAYIGLFVAPAALGLIQMRRAAPWLIAGIVLLLLARGNAQPLALWPILHRMPLFDSLRLPSRFLIPLTLMVGVLVGFGVEWVAAQRPWGVFAASAVILLATADCLLVGPPNLANAMDNLAYPPPPFAVSFRQVFHGPDNNSMLFPAMQNRGVVGCYDYTDWSTNVRASDQPGYRGEQYLIGPGSLRLAEWTPNALAFAVDVPAPAEIVVNQNYDRWWRPVRGPATVIDEGGLIGIRIPSGRRRIEIAYRDYGALIGGLITLVTLAIAAGLWQWAPRLPPCNRSLLVSGRGA